LRFEIDYICFSDVEETVVNNIYELASNFALRIVKLYKYLTENK
jgi:hypothetical protein